MTDVDGIIKKVEQLSKEEDHNSAEKLLREALEDEPEDPDLKTMLAIVLTRLACDDEAEELLRDVLCHQPTHERAASSLGHLLDSSLRTEEAETLYRTILAKIPHSHYLVDDLCRLLIDEHRSEEAHELASKYAIEYATEYQAYDAIRYVLQKLEDNYLFDMEEADYSKETCEILLLNLLEQFETIIAIETNIGVGSLEQNSLYEDVLEESVRLFCEIESLYDKMSFLRYRLCSELTLRVETALKAGRARRTL